MKISRDNHSFIEIGGMNMNNYKKLIGEKIYLAPQKMEEVEKFAEWLNDFSTTDYIGRSHQIVSLEAEKDYLEKHSKDEAKFSIIQAKTDEMIGTISLENIEHVNQIATLGIFIGEKQARNQGYGTEAIHLILDYGFNYLNLRNIELHVIEFNQRAYACYKKCGFKEIGRRRKCKYINGKHYDLIYMDILKEEFTEEYIQNKEIK